MKAVDLRSMDVLSIKKELGALLRAQCSLRMRVATQQSSGTAELRKIRRTIARARTVMTEKAGV